MERKRRWWHMTRCEYLDFMLDAAEIIIGLYCAKEDK